jgi:hypothetical protein
MATTKIRRNSQHVVKSMQRGFRFVVGSYSDRALRKRAILRLVPVVFVTICVSGVIGHLTHNAGPLWAIAWVLLTMVVLWFFGLLLLAAVDWL